MVDIVCKDLMSNKLVTLHPKDRIAAAKQVFENNKIHHIPICINHKIVGILSLGDVLAAQDDYLCHQDKMLKRANPNFDYVEGIMTPNPLTVAPETKLSVCVKLMKVKRINCLPISEGDRIVGIITAFDLIGYIDEVLSLES